MTGGLEVRALDDRDPLWDLIDASDSFSIYHRKAWKNLVEDYFRHKAMFIGAVGNGRDVDVLPLFLVRLPLVGKKLISTPFEACHGGLREADGETVNAVIGEVSALAHALGVKYVEIRSKNPIRPLLEHGFTEQNPFIINELALTNSEENWSRLSPKHRRNVRAAGKRGVKIEAATRIEEMRSFHAIVADHQRSVGIPFPSAAYFNQIWVRLVQTGDAHLLLAKIDEETVGGHLLFRSGETLISKYAGTRKDKKFRKSYASYALYWEGIQLGIEKGHKLFNMGITGASNTGLLDFKSRFGSDTCPAHFYVLPVCGSAPDYSTYYDGFRVVKTIWRYTPRFLTAPAARVLNRWYC